jgi:uracil-DNA glycosylase family 4
VSRFHVGPEGPREARLAVVAEKPAIDEIRLGRPLVGTSGSRLRHHLHSAGLDAGSSQYSLAGQPLALSKEVYLTNAVQNFDDPRANPTDAEIIREQPRLYRELCSMPNLNCVLALGASALTSVSNFQYRDISNRRGSRLLAPFKTKYIPTFHPAYYMRGEWRFSPVVQFDIDRAVREAQFPELRKKERKWNIRPTLKDALSWLDTIAQSKSPYISFDIETSQGRNNSWFITCIAFSTTPEEAYCIPITRKDRSPYWPDVSTESLIWRKIASVLNLSHKRYITQNGLAFDCWQLYKHGVRTPHMANGFDTFSAHSLLAPDLPHDLGFIVSIYTDEEYYKDESGRGQAGWGQVTENEFWSYNCKDAALTLESALGMMQDLRELGMYDHYMTEIQSQWDAVMAMQIGGLRIDVPELIKTRKSVREGIALHESKLKELLGWVPNTKSPIQMAKIFDQFHVVVARTKKTNRPKMGKEDLLNYAHRYPLIRPVLTECMEVTQRRTIQSNFLDLALDRDDKYHPVYRLNGTKTGRYASEGADEGGPQGQNWPHHLLNIVVPDRWRDVGSDNVLHDDRRGSHRNVAHTETAQRGRHSLHDIQEREMELDTERRAKHREELYKLPSIGQRDDLSMSRTSPEPGNELTNADLKQAEAMIVAWDAGDPFLIEAFKSGKDIHRIRGCVIFRGWDSQLGIPTEDLIKSIKTVCNKCASDGQDDCSHSERFLSKTSGHAFTYKMGPRKFVNRILPPAGVFISESEGKRIRDAVVTRHILNWHDRTEQELRKSRWLTNLLGRKREFYGILDMGGDLLREALSWKAQSVVGVIAGRAVTRLHKSLRSIGNGARLLTQKHDSVLVSHSVVDRERVVAALQEAFYCPINAHGRILNIPLEIASGPNWRDLN